MKIKTFIDKYIFDCLTLGLLFFALRIIFPWQKHAGIYPYFLSFIVCGYLIVKFFAFIWQKFNIRIKEPYLLILPLILLVYLFNIKFPFRDFDKQIFCDDYATYFYVFLRDTKILKMFGLSGWQMHCSGGYPTFLEGKFLGPVSIFFMFRNSIVSYHILIAFYYFLFPLLAYWWVKLITRNYRIAHLALWAVIIAEFNAFITILSYGMVTTLIALDLFILCLIALELFLKRSRYFIILLFLSSLVLFITYLPFFVFFIIVAAVRLLLSIFIYREKVVVSDLVICGGLLVVVLFPFLSFLIKFKGYYLSEIYPLRDKLFPLLLCFVLCNIYFIVKKKYLYTAVCVLVLLVIMYVLPENCYFIKRSSFLSYLFVPMLFALWAWEAVSQKKYFWLSALVVFNIYFLYPHCTFWHIRHVPADSNYTVSIADFINRQEGQGKVLLEDVSHLLTCDGAEFPPPPLHHYESQVMLLCPDKIFHNNVGKDPHPYHIFRETILDGTFNNKPLTQCSLEEVSVFLDRWGIEYLVVWSRGGKQFFGHYPEQFEKIAEYDQFFIYQYRKMKPSFFEFGGIIAAGDVVNEDWLSKEISFSGLKENSMVVLKMNYFPLWYAYNIDTGKPVELFSCQGQLAFYSPVSGKLSMKMTYPSYRGFLLGSIFAIILLAIKISLLPKLRRKI